MDVSSVDCLYTALLFTYREVYEFQGRITGLMASGKLFKDLDVTKTLPGIDIGMICDSMKMLKDAKDALEEFNLNEGSNNRPHTFVVKRAL